MAFEVIRAASDKDFYDIETNANIIWKEHYGSILSYSQIEYMLKKFQSFDAMKSQEKQGYQYYILYDNCFVGYCAVKDQGDKLFLSKLYILKEHRRKGYFKRTLSFLSDYARNHNQIAITLTVNRDNLLAIEAYKRSGFKTVRQKKTDIGNGFYMDDHIMERDIPASTEKGQ